MLAPRTTRSKTHPGLSGKGGGGGWSGGVGGGGHTHDYVSVGNDRILDPEQD